MGADVREIAGKDMNSRPHEPPLRTTQRQDNKWCYLKQREISRPLVSKKISGSINNHRIFLYPELKQIRVPYGVQDVFQAMIFIFPMDSP